MINGRLVLAKLENPVLSFLSGIVPFLMSESNSYSNLYDHHHVHEGIF